jgi:(p)ppGpp synthase/HD superfamily hydrolase
MCRSRFEEQKRKSMILTSKFDQALSYAATVHREQIRKGTGIPFMAHVLGVAAIALEFGADEEETIAALLHDAVEDGGGLSRLEDIRCRFGGRVAEIVAGCTDSELIPKPPWRVRKKAYLEHLQQAPSSTRLVSASDKLHNVRTIKRLYRLMGESFWNRLEGGKAGRLWYYRAVVDTLRSIESTALGEELDREVSDLEELAKI